MSERPFVSINFGRPATNEEIQHATQFWAFLNGLSPKERERVNQCLNCTQLDTCERGEECEDENGMCREWRKD